MDEIESRKVFSDNTLKYQKIPNLVVIKQN